MFYLARMYLCDIIRYTLFKRWSLDKYKGYSLCKEYPCQTKYEIPTGEIA